MKQAISKTALAAGLVKATGALKTGAISVSLVFVIAFAQASALSPFVGQPSDWTYVGSPVVTLVGPSTAAQATYENHVGITVLGLVVMVLYNSRGQAVYYTTSTVSLDTDDYGTVLLVAPGVAPGLYSATIFAMTIGGLAISNSTSISFNVG